MYLKSKSFEENNINNDIIVNQLDVIDEEEIEFEKKLDELSDGNAYDQKNIEEIKALKLKQEDILNAMKYLKSKGNDKFKMLLFKDAIGHYNNAVYIFTT